ncbi:hypothetical protein [Variovorax sp. 770b2]|uniref:hypothetical protein n=1 Tax=Variovorax sp. 770b2 TaxID=1566271 RepID=UPI0011608763|nr:hypothetical protein [Variovorax sp. 770b2]
MPTSQLRAIAPSGPATAATPTAFDASLQDGSRHALRFPLIATCLDVTSQAGFNLHSTNFISCTIRNVQPSYDAAAGRIRYTPGPGKGAGTVHLNTSARNNETLAALTIVHECAHAIRGARDHDATWPAYLHERLAE